jgi:hypothetical protein
MKKAVIVGLGQNFELFKDYIFEYYEVTALMDNDKLKQGKVITFLTVMSPCDIFNVEYDVIIILSSYKNVCEQLFTQFIELGVPCEKIRFFYNDIMPEYSIKSTQSRLNNFGLLTYKFKKSFDDIFGIDFSDRKDCQ